MPKKIQKGLSTKSAKFDKSNPEENSPQRTYKTRGFADQQKQAVAQKLRE